MATAIILGVAGFLAGFVVRWPFVFLASLVLLPSLTWIAGRDGTSPGAALGWAVLGVALFQIAFGLSGLFQSARRRVKAPATARNDKRDPAT